MVDDVRLYYHPTQEWFYQVAVLHCKKNRSHSWQQKNVRFKLSANGALFVKCSVVSAWCLCVPCCDGKVVRDCAPLASTADGERGK